MAAACKSRGCAAAVVAVLAVVAVVAELCVAAVAAGAAAAHAGDGAAFAKSHEKHRSDGGRVTPGLPNDQTNSVSAATSQKCHKQASVLRERENC